MLRAGKLPEDFIEGMICTGGCVNGPGVVKPQAQTAASRVKALSEADARTIEGSMAAQNNLVFSMHKSE